MDVAIPTNNKAKHSLGLIYWLLAREVLRLRGSISRSQPWDVMTDMFFYRDPEEAEKEAEVAPIVPAAGADRGFGEFGNEWGAEGAVDMAGGAVAAAGAPAGEWGVAQDDAAAAGEWGQPQAQAGEWGAPAGGEW